MGWTSLDFGRVAHAGNVDLEVDDEDVKAKESHG